ncbi:MAG TPA: hypothetical protein VFZ65_16755, partial [Planctomycetota bacterium]|nr:hypothetical protein [Planctomycetota bacterium]
MNRTLVVALLAGITAFSTPLLAQEGGEGGERGRRPASPLKTEMEKVEKALDAVTAFLKKPEGDAPLAEVAAAQEALHKAKQETPRLTARQPEDKQASFVTEYKIQINKTTRVMLDLEDAMLQKDWKAAGKVLEELEKMQKQGHDKFKGRRGGGPGGRGGQGGGRPGGGNNGGG